MITGSNIPKADEEKLQEKIASFEGIGINDARHVRPIWNWILCTYHKHCPDRKDPKEGERRICCYYNPNMYRCPSYKIFEAQCNSLVEEKKSNLRKF